LAATFFALRPAYQEMVVTFGGEGGKVRLRLQVQSRFLLPGLE